MTVSGYHAHVYFDAQQRTSAAALRELFTDRFGARLRLGRWHEVPVGPHSQPMYQVGFGAELLGEIVALLMLNRAGLRVLVHPSTGDDIADHTEHALWFGGALPLRLERLGLTR